MDLEYLNIIGQSSATALITTVIYTQVSGLSKKLYRIKPVTRVMAAEKA